MSEDKPRTAPDAGDLADAPFIDDLERAESAWLMARDNDPTAPAPSPALARDYAELEDLLANPPPLRSDERWQDEVSRLASSSEPISRRPQLRRIYRWAIGGTLAAAAAVAVLVLRPRPRPDASELEIEIRHGASVRGDSSEATPGDRLVIKAHPRGTGELRVYRADGPLVARCPDGPGCSTPATGEPSIDVRLDAPGQYHVILVIGMTGDSPAGTMDTYLDAARAANTRIVRPQPIEVR